MSNTSFQFLNILYIINAVAIETFKDSIELSISIFKWSLEILSISSETPLASFPITTIFFPSKLNSSKNFEFSLNVVEINLYPFPLISVLHNAMCDSLKMALYTLSIPHDFVFLFPDSVPLPL